MNGLNFIANKNKPVAKKHENKTGAAGNSNPG